MKSALMWLLLGVTLPFMIIFEVGSLIFDWLAFPFVEYRKWRNGGNG